MPPKAKAKARGSDSSDKPGADEVGLVLTDTHCRAVLTDKMTCDIFAFDPKIVAGKQVWLLRAQQVKNKRSSGHWAVFGFVKAGETFQIVKNKLDTSSYPVAALPAHIKPFSLIFF